MSQDIVKRLREMAEALKADLWPEIELLQEAAETIEKLRADIEPPLCGYCGKVRVMLNGQAYHCPQERETQRQKERAT